MDTHIEFKTRHDLVTGDARDLHAIADGSVNLVLTSPPYPMIALWDGLFSAQDQIVARALEESRGIEAFDLIHRNILFPVWQEVWRVLADGGFACINIGDAVRTLDGNFRLYPNGPRIVDDCHRIGFDVLPQIIWRKPTNAPNKFMGSGVLPAGAYVTLEHEHILILRKGRKRDFSADNDKARRLESAIFWEERNSWFSDLWDLRGTNQKMVKASSGTVAQMELASSPVSGLPEPAPFVHEPHALPRDRSAAFPLELAERLILMYSLQGDTVLDPFLGTGTTTLAAIGTGRHSVGVECEPELAAYCLRRCTQEIPVLNQRVADRLGRHVRWATEYQAKNPDSLKHINELYRTPVMTSQEEKLHLFYVAAMQAEGAGTTQAHLAVTHHRFQLG